MNLLANELCNVGASLSDEAIARALELIPEIKKKGYPPDYIDALIILSEGFARLLHNQKTLFEENDILKKRIVRGSD